MDPWYKRTFLWGQTNLTEDDPVKCDLDFWKQYWKESKAEGIIINCSGIVSYYQSKFAHLYHAKYLGDKDYFETWNKAAREAGLTVIARMDINTTAKALYDLHPDWYARDSKGDPILSQERYVACVNGNYYQEFIPEIFKEIIGKYHPDGFADNSWAGLGRKTICYCDNCRKKFKEAYGLKLPEKADWKDKTYRKWIKWSYETRVNNWNYFNQVTKEAGGPDCRWFGMLNADPFHTGDRFYDIKKLIKDADFIFCDHQSRDAFNGFEQNSVNGALLRMASNEENLVAESMSHYYKGLRTFRLSASPKQETLKWMLSGIGGGIMPWYHFVGGGTQDRRKFKISAELFRWHKENREYLSGRENCAAVGLIWNQESSVYYGREEAEEKSTCPWVGFTRALSRYGIPFLPVHSSDIDRYADRLQTIVLPNVAILSKEEEEAVIRFLHRGKNVILTGVTGLMDEEGELKPEDNRKLWDCLGLSYMGGREGVSGNSEDNWMNHITHNYLKLPEERHPVLKGFEDTELLPFGGEVLRIKSKGNLKSVASYIPAFPIYPPEFSWIREEAPEVGTVLAGTLENGARIIYMAADIDRCYSKFLIPDHGRLLAESVRWASEDKLPVTVSGKGHVNCNSYIQGRSLLIHLVNLSGCDVPVGTLTENLPAGPLKICLRGFKTDGTAFGLVSEQEYKVEAESDRAFIRLDLTGEHELVKVPLV